jgi:hypothetical protein
MSSCIKKCSQLEAQNNYDVNRLKILNPNPTDWGPFEPEGYF